MAQAKSNTLLKRKAPPAKPAPGSDAPGLRAPGVIATLVELLREGGGTRAELYEKLAARFPDRATAKGGLRTTIQIQLKKLHQSGKLPITTEEIESRGTVYKAALL